MCVLPQFYVCFSSDLPHHRLFHIIKVSDFVVVPLIFTFVFHAPYIYPSHSHFPSMFHTFSLIIPCPQPNFYSNNHRTTCPRLSILLTVIYFDNLLSTDNIFRLLLLCQSASKSHMKLELSESFDFTITLLFIFFKKKNV